MTVDIFEQLASDFQTGGVAAALDRAEAKLRNERRFHELFEVLKMKTRQQLGLPILYEESNQLSETQQRQLEDALLAACEDVGFSLMRAGQVQESWGYLKHLPDRDSVLAELNKIEVNEDNLEAIVGLLLYEGLDCDKGYALVLERYGTCNAITTMQNAMYGRSKSERQATGKRLVKHVHSELLESVKTHIEREEGTEPQASSLQELMKGRDFLFSDGSYHIDTSHLSSTVQIASELTDKTSLELALDLTHYGVKLHQELQYPSPPPFEETYPAHGKFFAAQLGQDVDKSVSYFRERAKATDAHQEGTSVIEIYIDLLARIGQPADAIEAHVQFIPPGIQVIGRAPTLYELSEQLGDFKRYQQLCREREDLLGYLVGLAPKK